jgi:aldehyde:ferredoxin oxidoreductase
LSEKEARDEKILRINMSTGHYRLVDNSGYLYINLGGRALTSHIISEETPPATDPLDPENRLIFAPGILAGTRVPNSGRPL